MESGTEFPENTRTLSLNELAYLRFKQALITLVYKPGDYLNTAQVMADLEMGRTPINQAIHRLAAEGLLQVIPRKGVMVSPLSIDDALELIEVRLANEALCIRLAVQRISEEDIRYLRQLNLQIDRARQQRDRINMMLLDRQFHHHLATVAANRRLIDILSVIHAQAQRFWATTLSNEVHMHEVIDEHNAIIEALAAGDATAADSATRAHIMSFKQALVAR
ncbi:GntR family transcriptional regulator [Paramixta manurensis]|uniref:GntR family transcriptional regulator n=1 Tax=Paramixta manurensis TaxID=2740817 RepID=A0A6M8UBB4_9GAMM|nr:GntR family transcriptional regulator [Erwiniaceae bacterium PD-1]